MFVGDFLASTSELGGNTPTNNLMCCHYERSTTFRYCTEELVLSYPVFSIMNINSYVLQFLCSVFFFSSREALINASSTKTTMKLSFISFALASAWRSVSGSDAKVEYPNNPTHEQHLPSLFEEEARGGVTISIVGGGPVDPREYKVGSPLLEAARTTLPKLLSHKNFLALP